MRVAARVGAMWHAVKVTLALNGTLSNMEPSLITLLGVYPMLVYNTPKSMATRPKTPVRGLAAFATAAPDEVAVPVED